MSIKQYARTLAGALLLAAGPVLPAAAGAQCTDAACFLDAVRRCEPAAFETGAPDDIGALGRYRVLGPTEYACRLEFVFTENPNPAYVDKPFTFLVDPSLASRQMLRDVVATCLMGGEAWYQCEGLLIEQVAGVSDAPDRLDAGAGPLPCGDPVAAGQPGLFPMPESGKWGYVDRDGNWRIPPQWDRARDFHEGRAMVGSPGGWGVIDRAGREIVPPQYRGPSFVTIDHRNWHDSPFSPYSEGCTVMTHFTDETQPSFFVDREGNAWWRGDDLPEALQGRDVRRFGVFSEGLAWFREGFGEDARFGWVDAGGEIVIPPEFTQAGRFSEGLAFAAVRDGQGAFISPDGSPVLPRKWVMHRGGPFSEGLARASLRGSGLADWTRGDVAFDEVDFGAPDGDRPARTKISHQAGDFHSGLAPVITAFRDGGDLVYVRPDGTVAFIPDDIEGVKVCNRRALPGFHNGLLRLVVADDGETCGHEGHTYGLARYETAHYIYLDTEGRVVLRQEK